MNKIKEIYAKLKKQDISTWLVVSFVVIVILFILAIIVGVVYAFWLASGLIAGALFNLANFEATRVQFVAVQVVVFIVLSQITNFFQSRIIKND